MQRQLPFVMCRRDRGFRSTNKIKKQEEMMSQHRRSEMKKFLMIAGLLTVVATPAFAQNFTSSAGTGNVLPYYYNADGRLVPGIAPLSVARATGDNAFAMAPREKTNSDPDSPTNTGGGSEGYNWELSHVQP
jgi:hypothetical protein